MAFSFFFNRRLGLLKSDSFGGCGWASRPRWTGVEGRLGSPSMPKLMPDLARRRPRCVGVNGKFGLGLAGGAPFVSAKDASTPGCDEYSAGPSGSVASMPFRPSLAPSGGEARGFWTMTGYVFLLGVYSLRGFRDLRLGVARSPCPFTLVCSPNAPLGSPNPSRAF